MARFLQFLGFSIVALHSISVFAEEESPSWKASGSGGAVAAGDPRAVEAGLSILREGGNAADAAVATIFALAVTDYGLFAIGGEVPLMIWDAERREVKTLSGVGRAPLDPNAIDWLYENGIPSQGSMKASLVPGAVDLCVTTLRLYGTRSLSEVIAPTLRILETGKETWHPALAVTLGKLVEAEKRTEGTRAEKLIAARDRFYMGDIAEELEAWYIEVGAFLRKSDLAAHRTLVEDPVSIDYRGYRVYKCSTWTQGPTLLQALGILEGFDLRAAGRNSADYVHLVAEALKLAFADRDTWYGDPTFVDVPIFELLSKDYSLLRRSLVEPRTASTEVRPGDPRRGRALLAPTSANPVSKGIPVQDTTTCVVADRWGNVVAATPSCNLLTNRPGPSGVTQGNRVRSLNTAPGHPNRLEPGKRPRVTLTPTLVTKDGKPILAISVAGGDLQDQTTLEVFLHHIEFDMAPDEAVTAPRFHITHHQNSFDPDPDRAKAFVGKGGLELGDGLPENLAKELADRGHQVKSVRGPIGYPVMLWIDPTTGRFHAAGDPTARRHAGAIEK
jgi:gamma-glutamyltranspeptidase/glutathione hydrolase